MLKKLIKLLFIFGLFYQTPIYSKSTSFNDFNSRDLSNYFSGIIAYENQNNSKALKFFKFCSGCTVLNIYSLLLLIYDLLCKAKFY